MSEGMQSKMKWKMNEYESINERKWQKYEEKYWRKLKKNSINMKKK